MFLKNKPGLVLVLLAMIAVFAACSKTDADSPKRTLDRKPMLINYADHYILPGYDSMKAALETLETSSQVFTGNPGPAALQQLRDDWRIAYLIWQQVDMLEFGPAEDVSLRSYMNIYPATESKIENNISSGDYDLETFGNKDAQGFPALDYLINGLATTETEIIEKYTTDSRANARKQYLHDILNKMRSKVDQVCKSWQGYRNNFVESTSTDVNGSISKMINAYVMYYERYLRSGKIGYPVGAMSGTAMPSHVEAFYSPSFSKELAMASLESVQRFYEGKSFDGLTDGQGMKDYLLALGTEDDQGQSVAEAISDEFTHAYNSLSALDVDLKDAVISDRTTVLKIYDALQKIVASLKVDLVSAFGISISYTDNDGD